MAINTLILVLDRRPDAACARGAANNAEELVDKLILPSWGLILLLPTMAGLELCQRPPYESSW